MIAELAFDRRDAAGVRRARFVPRASIPLGAACLVANGIREVLRELLGERCEVTLGEPAAIGPRQWEMLSRDAYGFLICGRQTDVVLIVATSDARALVQRAFGETEPVGSAVLSALEEHALERIAGRCAGTLDPLCAERRSAARRVDASAVPACVAFFDVRVAAPIDVEFGIGIVRELPDPGASGAFPPGLLDGVPLDLRVEFATGTIDAGAFLSLAPGDIVSLDTQVGAPACLKIADRFIASGIGGVTNGRYSLEIQTVFATGDRR